MYRIRVCVVAALGVAFASFAGIAGAETISGALAKAYGNNADLNAARAGVRVTDESVAIAKSGWRPIVQGEGTVSFSDSNPGQSLRTGSIGITINQSLFDGFQTRNNVAAAESQVLAQRENLRNTEQNILANAASAYMDVIQDRAIAGFRAQNLAFLDEQVRAAQARFDVGEGTRTDVAQARAQRAAALAQLNAAKAQARSSEAVYRQIVGEEPGKLQAPKALSRGLPQSLDSALANASNRHPAIVASLHVVDVQGFRVKSSEGALLPQLGAQATVSRNFSNSPIAGDSNQASVSARLTVPIYQGGRAHATVRQNKETLGQARIQVDAARDNVRAAVTSAFTQLEASRAQASANQQALDAARLALSGVMEERAVGQRTTLDVLNAQADVINTQIALTQSQRNVVVASYALMSAVGNLNIRTLGLKVAEYKPEEHYEAVKDKWFGLRTPDGR